MLWPGEICWTAIRNLREDPSHAAELGLGKERPGILVAPTGSRWLVIGTTTKSTFADGSPRMRIPAGHWEAAHPPLGGRAGYLWGDKVQFVPTSDIGDHIGTASPELRRLAMAPLVNTDAATRAAFLDEDEATGGVSG
jgi:hypothetical protein